MEKLDYQLDDELRILDGTEGKQHIGVRRTFKAPSEALKGHIDAVKEFGDKMEVHLADFEKATMRQIDEIDREISHGEFFLNEFKDNQWNANPMFDRLRIHYTSQIDSLRKEKRRLQRDRILKKIALEEKLVELKKELSPFSRLF